jgi:hypothetical protein
LSFNLPPNVSIGAAVTAIQQAAKELHLPASIARSFQGSAQAVSEFTEQHADPDHRGVDCCLHHPWFALREHIHPITITIISTLPSAGLGALFILLLFGIVHGPHRPLARTPQSSRCCKQSRGGGMNIFGGIFNSSGWLSTGSPRPALSKDPLSVLENDVDPAIIHPGIARPSLADRLLFDHRPRDAIFGELVGHDRAARLRQVFACLGHARGAGARLNDDCLGAGFPRTFCGVYDNTLCFVRQLRAEFVEIYQEARDLSLCRISRLLRARCSDDDEKQLQ